MISDIIFYKIRKYWGGPSHIPVLQIGPAQRNTQWIKWTHDQDVALEWTRQQRFTSWHFRDGCEVDTSTGVLTISNLALNDSGSYTAEINDEVMSTTEIIVITTVPNPTVSTWCHPEMTYCTLTCEPNVTDDAKPITYYWMIGDMVKQSPTSQFNITQANRERLISCQLENPVSYGYSEKILNPLLIRNRALLSLPFVWILVFPFGLICCKCCCCTRRTRRHRSSTATNTVR
uniref:uncharacterized protein LOC101484482 n=1 Tax=Maylandia zebra TaxID=106582 RepID=UPI00032A1765|nr:uncharacterized protein LOC101484482 [Maylandia zebra]